MVVRVHTGKLRARLPRAASRTARWPRTLRWPAAVALPGAALLGAANTVAAGAFDHPGGLVLLGTAWVAAAIAADGWLSAAPGRAALGLGALAAACAGYAALLAQATDFLAPDLRVPARPASPWLVLLPAAAATGALLLRARGPRRAWARVYVRLLDAGQVTARFPATPLRRPRPAPLPAPALGTERQVAA